MHRRNNTICRGASLVGKKFTLTLKLYCGCLCG